MGTTTQTISSSSSSSPSSSSIHNNNNNTNKLSRTSSSSFCRKLLGSSVVILIGSVIGSIFVIVFFITNAFHHSDTLALHHQSNNNNNHENPHNNIIDYSLHQHLHLNHKHSLSPGAHSLQHCNTGMIRYSRKFLGSSSSSSASSRNSWMSPRKGPVLVSGMKSIQDLAKVLAKTKSEPKSDDENQNINYLKLIQKLNTEANFENLFQIESQPAQLKIPSNLKQKASAMFADYKKAHVSSNNNNNDDPHDVHHIENQHVVTSTNKITSEMSLFNELRKYRPGAMRHISPEEDEQINQKLMEKAGENTCDFCSQNKTAEDVFGRVIGEHCFTSSNIAKMSKWHGLVINNRHHPFLVTKEEVHDWLKVAAKWFRLAHERDPEAKYPHLIYDAGPRASASQPHLHLHVILNRQFYLTHSKNLLDRAFQYSYCEYGGLRDYWCDWIRSHEAVGLALHYRGSWLVVSLTPVHDKEIFVIGNSDSESFATLFHFAISVYVKSKLQVRAFSMGMFFESLGTTTSSTFDGSPSADNHNNNNHHQEHSAQQQQQQSTFYPAGNRMPAVARFMDRGAPFDVRNDVGAMDFYGAFNVGTDPFFIMENVQEMAKKKGLI